MAKKLKLMQLNIENFFVFLDKPLPDHWPNLSEDQWQSLSNSTIKLKPLAKIRELAQTIKEVQPDIVGLCEVGGLESLENFNRLFLDEQYECLLKEGNSDRGIDIGYLVKRDLAERTLLISHRHRPINFLYDHEVDSGKKSHYFSRDVAELRLFSETNRNKLMGVFLTVHLKSKLDPDGIDPEGRKRRKAELETVIDIYHDIQSETKGQCPVILMGDFNGRAHRNQCEPEFERLHTTSVGLLDAFDIIQLADENRFTQVNFNSLGGVVPVQIDYIFISGSHSHYIQNALVYRYKDEGGMELHPPTSIEQRAQLPSDHYPIICELLFDDI